MANASFLMYNDTVYHRQRYATDPIFRERKKAIARETRARQKARDPIGTSSASLARTRKWRGMEGATESACADHTARQNNCCALCGEPKKLVWDHDHETKAFRGMLCIGCNVALGRFGDNEAGVLRTLAYLRGEYHVNAMARAAE